MEEIRRYVYEKDYNEIMKLIVEENWQSYFEERKDEFKIALENSITYVIYEDNSFVGFVRGLTDGCFTLFIAEIIVSKDFRRHGYGRKLIDSIHQEFPKTRIDLLSDDDNFYLSQGFHIIGNGMRKHNWY